MDPVHNRAMEPSSPASQSHSQEASSTRFSDVSWSEYIKVFRTRIKYYIPVLGWLPKYNIELDLRHDILAGITVAFLLIPQSLSYAHVLVKIPPVYGLYTCFSLIIYSLLGTSRQLAVGPEALVSILVGSAVKNSFHKSPNGINDGINGTMWQNETSEEDRMVEAIATANLLGLMVGLFTFTLGKLGFLDSVLSRPLLRGFITAVAVVVCIDMGPDMFGIRLESSQHEQSPMSTLIQLIQHLGNSHLLTTAISIFSVFFVLGFRFLKSRIASFSPPLRNRWSWVELFPEILVLVIGSILLCSLLRLDEHGVKILENVHGGMISPRLPPKITLVKINDLFLPSILIAVVGFVESIVVSKTYASTHNYTVSPNRELVAIGIGNVCASFLGAWPAFGSLSRSAVNDAAGAKTQLAGFITGVFVFITIFLLLPLFYFLPKAVCSAIIVCAAVKLIELEDVIYILKMRAWNDLGLLLLTFLTTIFISIESGILISVGVSLLLVVKHTAKTRIAILGKTYAMDPDTGFIKTKFKSIKETGGNVDRVQKALIIRIEEGLFFGNSGSLKDRIKRIEKFGELGVHPSEEPRIALATSSSGPSTSYAQHQQGKEEDEEQALETQPLLQEPIKCIVFDVESMTEIDSRQVNSTLLISSATQVLFEIVESYKHRHIQVGFVKLREGCRSMFYRSGLYELVGDGCFFSKIKDALDAFQVGPVQGSPASAPTHLHILMSAYVPPHFGDVTKSVNDLFGKDFPVGFAKLEANTTASNGIKFTASGSKDNKSGAITSELKTKFTDKAKGLTLTETWNSSNVLGATVELQDSLAKGLKLELNGQLHPSVGKKGAKAAAEYKQEYVYTRSNVDLFKGPTISADAVAGVKCVHAGVDVSYDVADAKVTKVNTVLAHSTKEYTIALQASNFFGLFTASYYHKVQPDLEAGGRATWNKAADAAVGFELGSKYTLDQDAFLKAKINNTGILGLGYTQNLRPGIKLSLGGSFDTTRLNENAHKLGVSFTFDA